MQTITISINDNSALKTLRELEEKHFISIVGKDSIKSTAIPGEPLNLAQFRKWIEDSEQSPTVSFEEAKSIWKGKRKQLQKIIQ